MSTCPQCQKPATRKAFPKSDLYVTCSNGHVFVKEG